MTIVQRDCLQSFRVHGYFVVPAFLNRTELSELRRACDTALDRARSESTENGHTTPKIGVFTEPNYVSHQRDALDRLTKFVASARVCALLEGLALEGEDDTSPTGDGDQIDEAWIYFSGGFGELRVGSIDDALGTMCVFAPGGTANFSAYSPNQWGANTLTSNSICFGVDDVGDSQKLLYLSPIFSGFQLALSYVPSSDKETHGDGVGTHIGMPTNVDGSSRHNVSAYGVYNFEAENWWLQVGAGGSWEGNVEQTAGPDREESDFYQTGILLGFGDFQVGASFNYFNDDDLFVATLENGDVTADRWVLGVGASYTMDVWTFGIGYSIYEADIENEGGEDSEFTLQRAVITANYNLGPGIDIDGAIGYTWQDVSGPDFDESADNYDAVEMGIGTAITF